MQIWFRMNQKTKSGLKIISHNRKAKFNYFFKEFFEAGIVLKGSEVKSLRDGKANISESYAFDLNGEIFNIGGGYKNSLSLLSPYFDIEKQVTTIS